MSKEKISDENLHLVDVKEKFIEISKLAVERLFSVTFLLAEVQVVISYSHYFAVIKSDVVGNKYGIKEVFFTHSPVTSGDNKNFTTIRCYEKDGALYLKPFLSKGITQDEYQFVSAIIGLLYLVGFNSELNKENKESS